MPGTNVATASCPTVSRRTRAGSQIRECPRDGSRVGCAAGSVWDTPRIMPVPPGQSLTNVSSGRRVVDTNVRDYTGLRRAVRAVPVGAVQDRAGGGLEGEVEGHDGGGGVRVDSERVLLHRVDHEVVAVDLVTLR